MQALDFTPLILTYPEIRQLCCLLSRDAAQPGMVHYRELSQYAYGGILTMPVLTLAWLRVANTHPNMNYAGSEEGSKYAATVKHSDIRRKRRPVLLGCSTAK